MKPREFKTIHVYRGKIEDNKVRTYVSWDGPPSDAYKEYIEHKAYTQLLEQAEAMAEALNDCINAMNDECPATMVPTSDIALQSWEKFKKEMA